MSQEYIDKRQEINYTSNIIHQIYGNANRTRFTFYLDYTIHATLCAMTSGTTYSETAFNFFHYFETPFKYHARRNLTRKIRSLILN